jgi:hypothetical protein
LASPFKRDLLKPFDVDFDKRHCGAVDILGLQVSVEAGGLDVDLFAIVDRQKGMPTAILVVVEMQNALAILI